MERVCGTLEQESSRLTQTMGETVFELYTSLKIFKGFREFLPLKLVLRGFDRWSGDSVRTACLMTQTHQCRNLSTPPQGRQDVGTDGLS